MPIGDCIRLYQEALDMTQDELGRRCGTSRQNIYKYEMGLITNIPLPRLEKIADALHITAATLLGWDAPGIAEDVVTFPITGVIAHALADKAL